MTSSRQAVVRFLFYPAETIANVAKQGIDLPYVQGLEFGLIWHFLDTTPNCRCLMKQSCRGHQQKILTSHPDPGARQTRQSVR